MSRPPARERTFDAFAATSRQPLRAAIGATLVLVAVAFVQAAPAAASDRASTRTYLRLQYSLVRAATANLTASVAGDEQLANRVKLECPNIAAGAPRRSRQRAELEAESMFAALLAFVGPDREAFQLFARVTSHLRWTNTSLTRLVHAAAAQAAHLSQLALPDLCGDWKAFVASGYRTLPQGSTAFLKAVEKLFSHVPEKQLILSLLVRYEGPTEKATVQRLRRFEKQNQARISSGGNRGISDVLRALGLPPLPSSGSVKAKPG